jgi:phosphoglycolate phosphatase-like HAD superfamily hydrolase
MRTEVLIFDLDGTLYDASSGYVDHIRSNIFEFMYEKVRSPLSLPFSSGIGISVTRCLCGRDLEAIVPAV